MNIIENKYKDGPIIMGFKGKNIIITEENCTELMGWTVEEYKKYTVYAPYIPEIHKNLKND